LTPTGTRTYNLMPEHSACGELSVLPSEKSFMNQTIYNRQGTGNDPVKLT